MTKPKDLTWENTMNFKKTSRLYYQIMDFADISKRFGYKYFIYEDRVYENLDDCFIYTKYKVDDVVKTDSKICPFCNEDHIMFDYGDGVYLDDLENAWVMSVITGEWCEGIDDFVCIKIQVNYCPECGRKLEPPT